MLEKLRIFFSGSRSPRKEVERLASQYNYDSALDYAILQLQYAQDYGTPQEQNHWEEVIRILSRYYQ